MDAFITAANGWFPGEPVSNEDIEKVLGELPSGPSRLRHRILTRNGIHTRYYAIDRETREPTLTTAQLAAEGIRALLQDADTPLSDVDLLACATSVPDQVVPGHASMVHGELGSHPCEIVTTHGVCCSSMTALKYAAMAVHSGTDKAVVSAAERTSSFLRAPHFTAEIKARTAAEEADPTIGFDQEFLRWMLSDGAGSALVERAPRPGQLSLKVEWIEHHSFAHDLATCMYMGGKRTDTGALQGWRDTPSIDHAVQGGWFNLHQDVRILGKHVIEVSITRTLAEIRKRRKLSSADVDWRLPHYSSEYFRAKAFEELEKAGLAIPC